MTPDFSRKSFVLILEIEKQTAKKTKKLKTSSFMHEISASLTKASKIEKIKDNYAVKSLRKKPKNQKIFKKFFLLTPSSKFFNDSFDQDQFEIEKKKRKRRQQLKVDIGFLVFDFKFQLNKLFKKMILPILESPMLIIGNFEKKVVTFDLGDIFCIFDFFILVFNLGHINLIFYDQSKNFYNSFQIIFIINLKNINQDIPRFDPRSPLPNGKNIFREKHEIPRLPKKKINSSRLVFL